MTYSAATARRRRGILRNFGSLTGGKILGDLCTFVLFVVVSRVYGQEGLGQYSIAMAIAGVLAVITDFGLTPLSIKVLTRAGAGGVEEAGRFLAARLVLAAVASLALLLLVPVLSWSQGIGLIMLVIGCSQILYSMGDGVTALMIAHEEKHLAALLELLLRLLTAVFGVGLAVSGADLLVTLLAFPVANILFLLGAIVVVARRYHLSLAGVRSGSALETLRQSIPYGLAELLTQLGSRIDILCVGFLLGAAAAGVYNAGYRIVFLLIFIPGFASRSIFPLASRMSLDALDSLQRIYNRAARLTVLIGLPASVGLWLVADRGIDLLYGAAFAESAVVLRYLAPLLFLIGMRMLVAMLLTARDRQPESTRAQGAAALLNLVGNLILVPTLGIEGAALATVLSEAFLVIVLVMALAKDFGWPRIESRVLISVAGCAVVVLVSWSFPAMPLLAFVPAAVVGYALVLVLFRETRENEAAELLALFRRQRDSRGTGQR